MSQFESKRVFFLYPHSVFQDHLLEVMVQAEFEVAIIKDHTAVVTLLRKFPESILFINIEQQIQGSSWEEFMHEIRDNQAISNTKIGILSYNPDPELAHKYIDKFGIECGFITLKLGIKQSATILLKTLALNEAKGRRKYVRAQCPHGKAHINIRILTGSVRGMVHDISVAGFSTDLDSEIKKDQLCDDIQLNLWGTRLSVSARLFGTRKLESGRLLYIFLFEPALDSQNKNRVHNFVRRAIQSEVDQIANQR